MIDELLNGLAWQLHGAGLGVWLPTGGRSWEGDPATRITVRNVPADPDRLIVLTPYLAVDDPDGLTDTRVNVRFRGTADPRTVQQPSDRVFELWQDLADVDIGGVAVVLIHRLSGTSLGQDDNDRHEHSDNYRVQFDWSTHRTD